MIIKLFQRPAPHYFIVSNLADIPKSFRPVDGYWVMRMPTLIPSFDGMPYAKTLAEFYAYLRNPTNPLHRTGKFTGISAYVRYGDYIVVRGNDLEALASMFAFTPPTRLIEGYIQLKDAMQNSKELDRAIVKTYCDVPPKDDSFFRLPAQNKTLYMRGSIARLSYVVETVGIVDQVSWFYTPGIFGGDAPPRTVVESKFVTNRVAELHVPILYYADYNAMISGNSGYSTASGYSTNSDYSGYSPPPIDPFEPTTPTATTASNQIIPAPIDTGLIPYYAIDGSFVGSYGSAGSIPALYDRTLVLDLDTLNWGSCDTPIRILHTSDIVNYAANKEQYQQGYTIQNYSTFLRNLYAVNDVGDVIAFDNTGNDASVLVGRLSLVGTNNTVTHSLLWDCSEYYGLATSLLTAQDNSVTALVSSAPMKDTLATKVVSGNWHIAKLTGNFILRGLTYTCTVGGLR